MSTTKIIVTDTRFIASGHADNKAVCVAVSAAVQTFGRCVAVLGLLATPINIDEEAALYDVQLIDDERSRLLIAAVLDSLGCIARLAPGMLEISDNRQTKIMLPPPPENDEATESVSSYAESLGATAVIRAVDGTPLVARA